MRHHRLLLAALLVALAAGCSDPCRDLGDKVCKCGPTGTSEDTCKRQVQAVVKGVNPSDDEESVCSDYLDSCDAPGGASFCEWLDTSAGKQACGLAY